MKKVLSVLKTLVFILPVFFFGFISSTFAQTSQLSVQVLASGLSVIDPEPEFTVGLENTIFWSVAELAVEYYAEVSTDGSFGTVTDNSGWIAQLIYTFENLDDDTKYYYRVKSRNSGNTEGPWSTVVFSTQDDNAPTSNALDLAEEINTSSFTINISSFDQTSGVDQITLMYRKDGGAWTVYGNYGVVSSITFNSNMTGGDGEYEFYTIATDVVGNVEYEIAHTDASTIVDTTIPPPPVPVCGNGVQEVGETCDDGNLLNNDGCSSLCQIEIPPTPTPECGNGIQETGEACDDGNLLTGDGCSSLCQVEVIPEPEPVPENFVLIDTFGGFNVRDLDFISVFDATPIVTGYSLPLQKITWEIKDSRGKSVGTDYVRSDENGFWEVQLPGLLYGRYSAEFYLVEDGVKYSDSISFAVEESVMVTASGYAFADSTISVFYNNTWVEIGKSGSDGAFSLEFQVPYSYVGEIVFKSSVSEYFSKITKNYSTGTNFDGLLFPPILYPSNQSVPLNQFAKIEGYAVPNSKVNLYVNGEFYQTVDADSSGNFSLRIGKFVELKQFEITATQEIENIVSEFSDPVFIYVHRHNIPYIHTVGGLVERHFGQISRYSSFVAELLTIVGLAMTIFAGLLIASASTISGYYYLLHDWRSLFILFKPREKLKVQIAGIDMGNKEGLLYLSDPTSNKIVVRVLIDSNGVGYMKKIKGIFNACYIATRNASWVKSAILRRAYVSSYIVNQLAIKSGINNLNIVFDGSEELFIYPFTNFERWFDRLLLYLVLPCSIFATIASILSFYFIASYSAMALIIAGFVLIIANALMIGYRKTVVEKIRWNGE